MFHRRDWLQPRCFLQSEAKVAQESRRAAGFRGARVEELRASHPPVWPRLCAFGYWREPARASPGQLTRLSAMVEFQRVVTCFAGSLCPEFG